ncbi:MAG: CBS domain-containing protein, partial [Gemmatimonadaceae bacterium]
MSNADTFISTFASIERTLRARTQSERTASFYQLVDAAARWSPEVRRYRDDLKEFADLRNAIIHERSDGHVIAEPNDHAVERLKVLEGMVLRPPAVVPLFQGSVLTISPSDSLARAVTVMRENGFSQVPVMEDTHFAGLLTSDAVTRWLGAQIEDDVISLGEARVADVLR